MNNLTLGGIDTRRGTSIPFAYYETIAGGMGARPGLDGASAIHTHMTNSWNTPVEVFEHSYPVRLKTYAVRRNSGGIGRYQGGDGIIRAIELLAPTHVGLLGDRRRRGPYGLAGGHAGQPGRNTLVTRGKSQELPGKCSFFADQGALLRIETPGGGAWGTPNRKKKKH
jgi:N-methylhydantoinase B